MLALGVASRCFTFVVRVVRAGNDSLDEGLHRVEHRRRDLSFQGSSHVHGTHFLSMTASLRTQLDRTRQPGFAQFVAGWCAPVGAAASSAYAGMLVEQDKPAAARDSRPRQIHS